MDEQSEIIEGWMNPRKGLNCIEPVELEVAARESFGEVAVAWVVLVGELVVGGGEIACISHDVP